MTACILLIAVISLIGVHADSVIPMTTERKTLSKDTMLCYFSHHESSASSSRCYVNKQALHSTLSSSSSFSCSTFEYPAAYCPAGMTVVDSQSQTELANTIPIVISPAAESNGGHAEDASRSFFNCVTYTYCSFNNPPNPNLTSPDNLPNNPMVNHPNPTINPNPHLRGSGDALPESTRSGVTYPMPSHISSVFNVQDFQRASCPCGKFATGSCMPCNQIRIGR